MKQEGKIYEQKKYFSMKCYKMIFYVFKKLYRYNVILMIREKIIDEKCLQVLNDSFINCMVYITLVFFFFF